MTAVAEPEGASRVPRASRRPGRLRAGRVVARRLAELLAVLLLVTFATAFIVDLVPGNAAVAVLGENQPPEAYERVERELGLDKSLVPRYVDWLGDALRGDLGNSLTPPGGAVIDRLGAALPVSLQLALMGLALALLTAVPLALWSAWRPGGQVDRTLTMATFGLVSLPSFVAGMLLILVFVKVLGWFPRAEWVRLSSGGLGDNLHHAFLPALVVSLSEIPVFARVLRGDLIETLQQDFVTAARARGVRPFKLLVSEALRPSSLSLVTVAGVSLGRLIGSTVIAETLFGLPGLGTLIVSAALSKELAVLQGAVVLVAVIYVLVNALVDLSYSRLDPRLRRARI